MCNAYLLLYYKDLFTHTDINTYINGVVLQKKKKNMQNYAQIGDIDHYSLHNIFIISVVT